MPALVALVHMAAENRGAAVLDGMKNADLFGVQQMAVFFHEPAAMSTHHIGHLEEWLPGHWLVWFGALRASSGLAIF